MTLLNNKQKALLAQLARRAWRYAGSKSAEPLPDLDTWRRAQVMAACGKPGLSAGCDQRDFNLIAARLHSVLGEDGIAMNELLRAGTEQRRQMEVVLLRELDEAGLPQSYCEAIARSRWSTTASNLDDSQFKQLLMTVKARVRTKRRKSVEAVAA